MIFDVALLQVLFLHFASVSISSAVECLLKVDEIDEVALNAFSKCLYHCEELISCASSCSMNLAFCSSSTTSSNFVIEFW